MSLWEQIIQEIPALALSPNEFGTFGTIALRDDSDGFGAYIEKWDYSEPIPDGLKLGK